MVSSQDSLHSNLCGKTSKETWRQLIRTMEEMGRLEVLECQHNVGGDSNLGWNFREVSIE